MLPLHPLRFEPIFKPAIWGGRKLADMFAGAPAQGPIGEAWVLSDHGDNVSRVADGPLKGTTLRELMRDRREELLGPSLAHHDTFPLLLKFIDAAQPLSVQVHPDDELARTLEGLARGKTEAWIVMHAEPGSRIYSGLKAGVDGGQLEQAIANGTAEDVLHSFEPKPAGDCVFLPAGTVHALGGGITIFEVQQTSDVTYRLYDWNRVDAKTGRPRDLHIKQALACADYYRGPVDPIAPVADSAWGAAARLVDCPYFSLRHTRFSTPTRIEADEQCRIIVPLRGDMTVSERHSEGPVEPFTVILVPSRTEVFLVPETEVAILDIRLK
jgi:mannose-6-phosphate isomerase